MAVWNNTNLVVIGLSVLLAGQFGVALRGMTTVKAIYLDDQPGCVLVSVEGNVVAATFLATMFVDFVVLLLTVYKTYMEYKSMYHSGLIKLIFRDGLLYFVVV